MSGVCQCCLIQKHEEKLQPPEENILKLLEDLIGRLRIKKPLICKPCRITLRKIESFRDKISNRQRVYDHKKNDSQFDDSSSSEDIEAQELLAKKKEISIPTTTADDMIAKEEMFEKVDLDASFAALVVLLRERLTRFKNGIPKAIVKPQSPNDLQPASSAGKDGLIFKKLCPIIGCDKAVSIDVGLKPRITKFTYHMEKHLGRFDTKSQKYENCDKKLVKQLLSTLKEKDATKVAEVANSCTTAAKFGETFSADVEEYFIEIKNEDESIPVVLGYATAIEWDQNTVKDSPSQKPIIEEDDWDIVVYDDHFLDDNEYHLDKLTEQTESLMNSKKSTQIESKPLTSATKSKPAIASTPVTVSNLANASTTAIALRPAIASTSATKLTSATASTPGTALTSATASRPAIASTSAAASTPATASTSQTTLNESTESFDVFCGECSYTSRTRHGLALHFKSVHAINTPKEPKPVIVKPIKKRGQGKNSKFECDLCQYRTNSNIHLLNHQNSCRRGERTQFSCTCCLSIFSSYENMVLHRRHSFCPPLQVRLNQNKATTLCNLCGKVTDVNKLKRHIDLVHNKIKDRVCPECGMAFNNLMSFTSHRAIKHGIDVIPFDCDICGASCKSRLAIRLHIVGVHCTRSKRFKCSKCGKRFLPSLSHKKHEQCCKDFEGYEDVVANESNNFNCRHCKVVFGTRKKAVKHMVTVHEGRVWRTKKNALKKNGKKGIERAKTIGTTINFEHK